MCFRRRLSSKILKLLQLNHVGKSGLKQLEQQLYNAIKIHPFKDGSNTYPSFRLDSDKLKSALKDVKPNTVQLQAWLQGLPTTNGNFHIRLDAQTFIESTLNAVRSQRDEYGYKDGQSEKQRICVEFSSPNVAKPFHIGHLRTTIIGHVLSNLYEAAGHDVKRLNYLGDWGTQFGLLTLGLKKYGDLNDLDQTPLSHIMKAYVQINQDVENESGQSSNMTSKSYQEAMELFAQMEKGNPELMSIWSQLRSLSLLELDKTYKRLGVHFSHVQYESDYRHKADDVLKLLKKNNLLQYGDDGVGYVSLKHNKKTTRASVVKSDGTSLYLTRDIAAALDRQKQFNPNRMHYVVEMGQRNHFTNLVGILKHLDIPWANRSVDEVHVRFGRVQGMSTRKGQAVHLKELLDIARSKVIQSMEAKETTRITEESSMSDISDRLAVASIILQDLKSHRAKDYTFSWDRALSLKADSGIFVQYCHVRIASMMRNCSVALSDDIDIDLVMDKEVLVKLVIHIARYPEVFEKSLSLLEPHHLVQYLFQLCHMINAAYASCPVKTEVTEIAQARLLVFECSRQVVSNCLQVLGIEPLTQM